MVLYWLIVAPATLYAVYNILKHYGVFEVTYGAEGLSENIKITKSSAKKRKREVDKLNVYSQLTEYFRGLLFSDYRRERHKFLIHRLNIRSEVLDRFLTPEELRGKYILRLLLGIFLIPISVLLPVALIGVVLFIGMFLLYEKHLDTLVRDEDEIIDTYFVHLYLLLYPKLKQRSRGRLSSVVNSYLATLKSSTDEEVKDVMGRFAQFFLNNLSMYEDPVAVAHLRERYRSAVIVNFCNVATQSLDGVDNSDTLLTFKQELVLRKTKLMRKKNEILRAKGERSIYLIYIILFILIIVGWYSKLPTGFF